MPYFHVDEALIRAPARRCFELVLAVRRYAEWWRAVRCEPLGTEGTLRVGSRFRFSGGPLSWVIEVTGLAPYRRVDLRYTEGDLLGPVRWEFVEGGDATLVRYAYRGVQPNSAHTIESFASGRSLRLHSERMQNDAFAGMRRLLEGGYDVSGGDLFEAIHTLGAVRRFRPDPVPDALLEQVVAAAAHAASALGRSSPCAMRPSRARSAASIFSPGAKPRPSRNGQTPTPTSRAARTMLA
jgi:Polyketide cyclase / dehydrase and lipid transport